MDGAATIHCTVVCSYPWGSPVQKHSGGGGGGAMAAPPSGSSSSTGSKAAASLSCLRSSRVCDLSSSFGYI
jgi:hypothetical protein